MARVKRGVTSHAKHKKVLKAASGFYGRRKNTIRTAKAAVDKAGQYAYRDRRVKAGVAGKRHRLMSHDADYIRSHRGTKILKKGDESLVKWYMPYNR